MLRVERRCNLDWNTLIGDERTRFCTQCSHQVHNLDAMSGLEIDALRRDNPEGFCATYVGPSDMPFVVSSAPPEPRHLLAAAVVLATSLAGCSAGGSTESKGTAPQGASLPSPGRADVSASPGASQPRKATSSIAPPVTLSEEQRERLRQLGYVQ